MPARERLPSHHGLTPEEELAVLEDGELEVHGRILPASNVTVVATATLDGRSVRCVYKPVKGERPLWDFPDGSLAGREVAAYLVSEALGWDVVPLTIDRDGPLGPGMVQVWQEPDEEQDPVDIVPAGELPEGYLQVLDASDGAGRPVMLVHENTPALHRMAVFDAVVNNADRKGGHVLPGPDGVVRGVDHGVTFHTEPKLRTVLWGWAGESLTPDEVTTLEALDAALDGPLCTELLGLLARDEVSACRRRVRRLLGDGHLPYPVEGWPAIPWPPF